MADPSYGGHKPRLIYLYMPTGQILLDSG